MRNTHWYASLSLVLFTAVASSAPVIIMPTQILPAPFPPDGAIAVYRDTILVGSPSAANGGVVYIYRQMRAPGCTTDPCWMLTSELRRPNGADGDAFGASVDYDGRTLVVGSPGFRAGRGAAFVYSRKRDRFVAAQRLLGDRVPVDPGGEASFGVAVSVKGGRIAVTELPIFQLGSAYVFRRGNDGVWRREAKLRSANTTNAQYGVSVDLGKNTLVVGVDIPGQVDVFERRGRRWVEAQTLIPWDEPGGGFGRSVALRPGRLAVGSYFSQGPGDSTAGAVYVFEKRRGEWIPAERLIPSSDTSWAFLGMTVVQQPSRIAAISAEGIYVFERIGPQWVETAKLVGPDVFGVVFALDLMDWSGDTLVAVGYTGIWIYHLATPAGHPPNF